MLADIQDPELEAILQSFGFAENDSHPYGGEKNKYSLAVQNE